MKLEIASYGLEVFPAETKQAYEAKGIPTGDAVGEVFSAFLKGAKRESLLFLEKMGIDPTKLSVVRPLSEPDETGEVLFFAAARFFGRVLRGGDAAPRQSEEIAGLSVIFVGEREAFQTEELDRELPQA
ncbi:MAG: hypothetical protein IKC69_03290 [Clostridia bacterium]|nr:hypothetical protein [Clostridia bacterium]